MALELRADDVMPWGKYEGMTLREVYEIGDEYYESLYFNQKEYEISKKTHLGLAYDDMELDKTPVNASKDSKINAVEYGINDVIDWGHNKGKTLLEIFLKNESYFRYIISNSSYYVSQATVNKLIYIKNNMNL